MYSKQDGMTSSNFTAVVRSTVGSHQNFQTLRACVEISHSLESSKIDLSLEVPLHCVIIPPATEPPR